MHEIMDNKFYLGPKFGTLFNKKWITISELLHTPQHFCPCRPWWCGGCRILRGNKHTFNKEVVKQRWAVMPRRFPKTLSFVSWTTIHTVTWMRSLESSAAKITWWERDEKWWDLDLFVSRTSPLYRLKGEVTRPSNCMVKEDFRSN
jgi:hypothetical protein